MTRLDYTGLYNDYNDTELNARVLQDCRGAALKPLRLATTCLLPVLTQAPTKARTQQATGSRMAAIFFLQKVIKARSSGGYHSLRLDRGFPDGVASWR